MQISEAAECAVLGLLESQPMHGYEMFQQFQGGTLGQIIDLEMSKMYAFLKKLERLGYIEAELEPQGVRPPRKIFHLTELGHKTFFEWLTTPVERPREIRLIFLLKLYFVQHIDPKKTAHLIDQEIIACRNFFAHLQSHRLPVAKSRVKAFFVPLFLRSH